MRVWSRRERNGDSRGRVGQEVQEADLTSQGAVRQKRLRKESVKPCHEEEQKATGSGGSRQLPRHRGSFSK